MRVGLNSLQDFLALLVRRKGWVIAPFLGLSCAVAVLTMVLPETYVSETLILIRPRDVPEEFVKDLIAGTAEERLRSIEQTILSRTNLLQIIREFGSQMPELAGINLDEQVIRLRRQIQIIFQIERNTRGDAVPFTYFRISYDSRDPGLAQKVASKLTALFIEQDNRVRETQVFGTTEFLSGELQKIAEQLAASEAELKTIKSRRQFELPEQLESNLRTLDRLSSQKQANLEAMDRNATMRLNLESQLSQTPRFLSRTAAPTAAAATPPSVSPLVEEYRRTKTEYDQAAAKYTSQHPDVRAALAHLERIKSELTPELLEEATRGAVGTAPVVAEQNDNEPNPLYQQIVGQLEQVKTEFAIREREKQFVEAEIAKYSSRVENTPTAERDIADVLRQNADFQKQHEDLKAKLAQARLSESLENKQKGSQFVIVDPANYPLNPSKPDKAFVLLAGIMASLAASIGIAAAVDIARQKIWTRAQVEALWGVPVLVDIPSILTDSDLASIRRKKKVYAASSACAAVAYSFVLYGMYLNHDFVFQRLGPLMDIVYR